MADMQKKRKFARNRGGSFYVTSSGTTCVPGLKVTNSTLEMQLKSLQNQYAVNPHFLFEQENGLAGPATIELITRMMVLKISHQMSTRDYGP